MTEHIRFIAFQRCGLEFDARVTDVAQPQITVALKAAFQYMPRLGRRFGW